MLSIVKLLLENKENWKNITDKEDYHFLGVFSVPSSNFLCHTEDVTQLHTVQLTISTSHGMM